MGGPSGPPVAVCERRIAIRLLNPQIQVLRIGSLQMTTGFYVNKFFHTQKNPRGSLRRGFQI